jgi:hypothetical protein
MLTCEDNPTRKADAVNIRSRIAAGAVAALALAGGGIGASAAASANTSHPASAVSQEPTAPDTDAIQQGDQTSRDTTTVAAVSGQNGSENPENSSENAPSDGPGGHADPSGDVQHEFSGVE